MARGLCPHCGNVVGHLLLEEIPISGTSLMATKALRGVSYLCPSCNRVLSVAIDPISLMNDAISDILDRRQGTA